MSVIGYLCDGKACKGCQSKSKYCCHTTNIEHAVNFDEIGPDRYMEVPEPTLLDFAMTPEEFKKRMEMLSEKYEDDQEQVHICMDMLMCDTLRSLGYGDGIDIFNNTHMWYS